MATGRREIALQVADHSPTLQRCCGFAVLLALGLCLFSTFGWCESQSEVKKTDSQNRWVQHYYKRVAEFEKENAALEKGKQYIVFVGDSITEGFPLSEYFPELPVLNRGIGSDGIGYQGERGVLNRMNSSVFACSPSAVFLLIGVNDLPHTGKDVDYYFKGYRQTVEAILAKLPNVQLVLETLLPTGEKYKKHALLNPRIIEFNERLKDLAKEKSLAIIDLCSLYSDENGMLPEAMTRDGLHLKKEFYGPWADSVKRCLKVPK